ncbi:oxidoreductase [Lentzea aerocolonigenes]|uniref:Oxidoreductase n=1 Tax=Lentzea aerocolonigenes TaxID=68170 RepID=A0A0F0GZ48_LENAE|nr:FAD-dependent oxidoreductase [Lentzea aerocolonigenes]KJK47866.1 oxidoreductase [Lentzea aerocolonigenes]
MTSVDLVVVGAGVVGLAHAWHAVRRGLSVTVVERDEHAVGASVRNFGHGCFTAQDGVAFEYAMTAREEWLKLGREAGFWLRECGTVVKARHDDERAVLEELASVREISLTDEGAFLPLDIRVNPREAVHSIAALLASRGVTFLWSTNVLTVEPGLVRTSRGEIACRAAVVAVGHDVDRFFPDIAEERQIQRCRLRMLRVAHGGVIDPAVLTGFSMLRYEAFARCPSTQLVRERLSHDHPELVEAGLNLMFTQLPDGSLTIGDTHHYSRTVDPYRPEDLDDLVLTETARLLGVPSLHVLERWRGVYASAPEPFLTATPAPRVRAVSVTSGIGMTTALGLAPAVLDDLLQEL